jgi:shikimate kinase
MISQNIILTGFMGTGKTVVGKILAWRLARRFLDTDAQVERLSGLTVPEIFARHGESYFRDLESEVIESLPRYPAGSLVAATGGGAVLRENNRRLLRRAGVVVLLTASPAAILSRVGGDAGRPLLAEAPVPVDAVLSLLKSREPYYLECDFKIDTTDKKPSRIAEEIMTGLRSVL